MIRLLLLLLGTAWLRRHRRILAAGGVVSLALGISLFYDCLDGVVYFPLRLFGYLMLIEGVAMLAGATAGTPLRRNMEFVRAAIVIVLGVLVVFEDDYADLITAMLFAAVFAIDGALRIASAAVVRFPSWRIALAAGIGETLIAVLIFVPWVFDYAGTLEFCIALVLGLWGWSMLRLAWYLRSLPRDKSLPFLYSRGWPEFAGLPKPDHRDPSPAQPLIVRIWTASGTADHPVSRPIIDRYIGAEDSKGAISTGHSALEVKPDLYVSHYPAVDIDHSPDDFIRLLRATHDNDVEGSFQPSYEYESAQWCESTESVVFERYDAQRLRAYWSEYQRDNTYNLTNRNCSSTVVHALETAIEGVLDKRKLGWGFYLRAFLSPELMVAAHMRKRADTMAWTPGLVLDYTRAVRGTLQPPRISWERIIGYMRAMFLRARGPLATSRQRVPGVQR